jgi:uncharacterized DUF497 family protein
MYIICIYLAIWDPAKAEANLKKHGVCFSDAETVLFDPLALSMKEAKTAM